MVGGMGALRKLRDFSKPLVEELRVSDRRDSQNVHQWPFGGVFRGFLEDRHVPHLFAE